MRHPPRRHITSGLLEIKSDVETVTRDRVPVMSIGTSIMSDDMSIISNDALVVSGDHRKENDQSSEGRAGAVRSGGEEISMNECLSTWRGGRLFL